MDFMEKIEKISKKIGTAASETYNEVVDKSGKVIEDTKVKLSITEKEEKIYEMYAEMGSVVYEMYQKGENVGDVFGFIMRHYQWLRIYIYKWERIYIEFGRNWG